MKPQVYGVKNAKKRVNRTPFERSEAIPQNRGSSVVYTQKHDDRYGLPLNVLSMASAVVKAST